MEVPFWRDLFSTGFLNGLLGRLEVGSGDDSPEYTRTNSLVREINRYHSIPKTDYKKLDKRRKMLKAIAKDAASVRRKLHIKRVEAKPRVQRTIKRTDQTTGRAVDVQIDAGYKSQSLGRTLLSIEMRALRKAAYLKLLKEYYASKQSRDTNVFRATFGQLATHDQDLVGLHAGVKLEQLDPLHRGFEMGPDATQYDAHGDLTGFDEQRLGSTQEMARLFADWFNHGSAVPFFLFLEDTDFCRDDNKDLSSGVKKVSYSQASRGKIDTPKGARDAMVLLCVPGPMKLYCCPAGGARKHVYVCDTSGYHSPAKTDEPGWAASIWSEHYELFVARHEEFEWHHSSFESGNPVRCAGMIKIVNGRVVGVTNGSGHYRPRLRHLYNFLRALDQHNCLDANCAVRASKPKFAGTWPQFQQWYQLPATAQTGAARRKLC
jgi:hypothetical protein